MRTLGAAPAPTRVRRLQIRSSWKPPAPVTETITSNRALGRCERHLSRARLAGSIHCHDLVHVGGAGGHRLIVILHGVERGRSDLVEVAAGLRLAHHHEVL